MSASIYVASGADARSRSEQSLILCSEGEPAKLGRKGSGFVSTFPTPASRASSGNIEAEVGAGIKAAITKGLCEPMGSCAASFSLSRELSDIVTLGRLEAGVLDGEFKRLVCESVKRNARPRRELANRGYQRMREPR